MSDMKIDCGIHFSYQAFFFPHLVQNLAVEVRLFLVYIIDRHRHFITF